jgi:molybdate transport system ATP-binding protein
VSKPHGLRFSIEARVGRMRVDVALDTGAATLIVAGPNGAGKSCLLSLLLGARPVTRGRIAIGETVLLDTAAAIDVPLERRRIGYVPQDYALLPHLSVRQNVAFALASSPSHADRAAAALRVDSILCDLGIDAIADRQPHRLSGGEKQRVALARALSVNPRALLLDEPLAALDAHARREVRGFLAEYLSKLGLPTIVITHDAEDARQLGNRIAILEAGAISQAGTWEELAARPATRFVEEFVGAR